ncbi:MAG: toxin-antitoxin system HicB family antitoxin [Acidobacteriota bacterium]
MRKSNFALRLQPSLLDDARRTAEEEGVALNQLINVAVAEKVSAIRAETFFRERARRANIPKAIEILSRMGKGNPPMKGDEIPDSEKLNRFAPNGKKRAIAKEPRATSR